MPFTALTVVVPDSADPPGLFPIAIVTGFVAFGTVFPKLSTTATCTAGEITLPAFVFCGWTTNARLEGAPVTMSNGSLIGRWIDGGFVPARNV